MYGERILGLVEVIAEPKLLYQWQIYSVCNFKGKGCTVQELRCLPTSPQEEKWGAYDHYRDFSSPARW